MSVLLDSDVLVDYLRGFPAAGRFVDGLAVDPDLLGGDPGRGAARDARHTSAG